jgi:feruloyl esterase
MRHLLSEALNQERGPFMTVKRASVLSISTGRVAFALAAAAAMLVPHTDASAAGLKDLASIAPVMTCSALVGVDLSDVGTKVGGTVTITSATIVPASATNPADYCGVRGNIGPGTNSIVMRLPTNAWTQRYLQTGCGGECGNDNISYTQSTGCVPITNGTIASATTNMGHTGSQGSTWAVNNPQAQIDFAYRGVHVASEVAKAVIAKFYGKSPAYSYFSGCSDGGREALMAAQRYPHDFDGIAAGAPASDMDVQNTYHHGWRVLTNQTTPGTIPIPARNTYVLLASKLAYVHAKTVAACDALDGVVDGVIDDPRACNFDTKTLVCSNNGNETGCLAQAEADVVKRIHDGAVTADGQRLEPTANSEWGGELDWSLFVPAAQGASVGSENFVNSWAAYKTFFNTYNASWTLNDLQLTVSGFNNTVATSTVYAANNPDLGRFARHGGKLLLWHGWSDQHIPPRGTIKYWHAVNDLLGDDQVSRFARFYLFPGMAHCGSGLGPNTFDIVTPLMSWVETNSAPNAIVATNTSTVTSRPVYPYPAVARLKAPGLDPKVAANFVAYTPKKEPPVSEFVGNYLFSPDYPQARCHADGTTLVCTNDKRHDDGHGDEAQR